ncbi:hypothetical protein LA080_011818 [Diaporthe eres]|nr:hypothetical protein LA080_011818 [Diaporthe eres]
MAAQQLPPTDELITALKKSLVEPCPVTDKAPRGFDNKFERACASIQRNVFLDAGVQAFFAYVRAEPGVQTAVDRLPHSATEVVARRLCSVKPHPSVEALIHHIFHDAHRGKKRCKILRESNYPGPDEPATASASSPQGSADAGQPHDPGEQPMNNRVQRRTSPGSTASVHMQDAGEPAPINNHGEQSTSSGSAPSVQMQDPSEPQPTSNYGRWGNLGRQLPPITNVHPNNSSLPPLAANAGPGMSLPPLMGRIQRDTRQPTSPRHSQDMTELPPATAATEMDVDQHSLVFPDAKNVPFLLPHDTCAAVVKKGAGAAIRVVFGDTVSHLEIDLYANRIIHLARDLFEARLETEDDRFCARVSGDSVAFFEGYTLVGADRPYAERFLGGVFDLIKEDSLYIQGKAERNCRLISLHIKGNTKDPGCLKPHLLKGDFLAPYPGA